MKNRLLKNRVAFCLLAGLGLLLLAGCFQPVDIGETFVEKATAQLRLTNDSEDDSYILEGLELRNAEGKIEQSWEGLNLAAGKGCDLRTETSGSFTLWYRVKDTWISSTAVDLWEAGPVELALNKSHEFSFKRENFEVRSQDGDGDGLPDIWETENGFDPEYPADGGTVYVSADGDDTNNGTKGSPYKTLAKAAEKARRGLDDAACTVVVLGELNWQNGNPPNPGNQEESKSLFSLGKTRHPVIIRGEDLEDTEKAGVLRGYPAALKRVLYLGPGADITLLNIKITGGKQTGGGIYASGATLTLGNGTTVTGNESYDVNTGSYGGIYMERGVLVMEKGSSVSGNKAYESAGVGLSFSTLTMRGGKIIENHATRASGGLNANGCPLLEMFDGAEISNNTAGAVNNTVGDNAGGVGLVFSTLTMHQGSKISGNWVYSGYGGGLYVTGESTLIMEAGSEISDNHVTVENNDANAGWGGGLAAVWKSSIVMEGGSTISGNTAYTGGGGVHIRSSTSLTMKGGTISGNKVEESSKTKGWGGGLYLMEGASFTMTGGSIAGNTAGKRGGGIYLSDDALFTLQGGTVYGGTAADGDKNTATGETVSGSTVYGHAIYDNRPGVTTKDYDDTIISFPPTP